MTVKKRPTTVARRVPKRKPSIRHNSRSAAKKKEQAPLKDLSSSRVLGIGIFFTLLFLVMGYRAFTLQIIRGPELAEAARKQHITKEYVRGVRGNIIDRSGNILARSVDSRSIWMNPQLVKEKERAAKELSSLLGIPQGRMETLLHQKRKFIWLARKVDNDVAENVKKAKLYGVFIDHEDKRVYPYKALIGQLLGFVDSDGNGLEGIEKSFDDTLSGERVLQIVQRDAAGRRMMVRGTAGLSDLRGRDVRLTVDVNVQFFAEEALAEHVEYYGAKWGGCIVVDVPTGEILAWAQYPFFDPNAYSHYSADNRRNRIAMDALEQGSTIKSFLVAAALEENKVSPETMINCEMGKWKLGKVLIHDTHPYDLLPVKRVLHVSSNIGAAKMGAMLGAKTYHDYLTRVGFGSRTGLPLPGEAKGILRKANRWGEVDLASASFGQGVSATLAQMAQAYLTLANDGKKIPLTLTISDSLHENSAGNELFDKTKKKNIESERIFSTQTMAEVRSMLRLVVEEDGGTGKQARIPGMEVGGKTGTAQKADNTGKYGKGRVGSFVGVVPIEKPRYLICVLLDEPSKVQYGGVIAAPVFRSVALNTMAYHGLLPDSDDPIVRQVVEKQMLLKNKKNNNQASAKNAPQLTIKPIVVPKAKSNKTPRSISKTVPSVIGMNLQKAVEIIVRSGQVPEIIGSGSIVVSQSPKAGIDWPSDKSFTIWLHEGEKK